MVQSKRGKITETVKERCTTDYKDDSLCLNTTTLPEPMEGCSELCLSSKDNTGSYLLPRLERELEELDGCLDIFEAAAQCRRAPKTPPPPPDHVSEHVRKCM